MNNLSSSFKKFIGNKNTVTILGVVLCIIILYFAYNYRINQQVQLVTIPYANQEIPPKTLITEEMVSRMEVPTAFLTNASYYVNIGDIVGKYSNINSTIPQGSIFYDGMVTEENELPDALLKDIEEGYILTQIPVNFETTYGNSIMPDNKIDMYFRANDEDGKAMFGQFVEDVKVLAVRDASGNDVFGVPEPGEPAYIYVALPERLFILVGKVGRITTNNIDFMIVPTGVEYIPSEDFITIESEEIEKFINDRAKMLDSNIIDPEDDVMDDLAKLKEDAELNKKEENNNSTNDANNNQNNNNTQNNNR